MLNDTGQKIMADVFAKHGITLERMRGLAKAERQLKKQEPGLFDVDEVADMRKSTYATASLYSPPIEPMRNVPNRMLLHRVGDIPHWLDRRE